jgi:archaellum component FlaC
MAEETDYSNPLSDLGAKMREVEDKQRIMKDRLLLIGQNLVEMKDSTNKKILELKKDVETMKQNIERLSSFLETVSSEFSKFAKKEDLEILTKQAKMFQPLEFVRKRDSEK